MAQVGHGNPVPMKAMLKNAAVSMSEPTPEAMKGARYQL